MKRKRTHSEVQDKVLRDYYDRTSELEKEAPIKKVDLSFPKPRRLVALRLEEETLEGVKKLAASKGLNYSTLMRMWITERLRTEVR
ncbi:MAG: CopG family antitoxin [Elusimicrobiota bacterium]